MTDAQGYTPLDDETIARLRAGTGSLDDHIAKREHDLEVAADYGDTAQMQIIQNDLDRLRSIVVHQKVEISELQIPEELTVSNLVKQIIVDGEGLDGDDRWIPVNSAILTVVMNLETRLYVVEEKLGLEHDAE